MAPPNATPGSKMRVEGTSTIHDWRAESPIIAGFIEVGPNFPSEPGQNITPGKVDVRGKAEVTVSSLMSVEKNGQKYSDKMDDKMGTDKIGDKMGKDKMDDKK